MQYPADVYCTSYQVTELTDELNDARYVYRKRERERERKADGGGGGGAIDT